MGLEEYGQLLDAGLEEARVGVIPPGVDQVVAGDMERTRLKDIKVLFFVGANDTHLRERSDARDFFLSGTGRSLAGSILCWRQGEKNRPISRSFILYESHQTF